MVERERHGEKRLQDGGQASESLTRIGRKKEGGEQRREREGEREVGLGGCQ